MQSDTNGKSSLQREVIESQRQFDEWVEQQEKDGQKVESMVESVNLSYGFSTRSLFGSSVIEQKLALVHFKNGSKPSFAKGIPHYVDAIVDEFRTNLIDQIKNQLEEDPWSETTMSSPSSTGQSLKSETPESVGSPA